MTDQDKAIAALNAVQRKHGVTDAGRFALIGCLVAEREGHEPPTVGSDGYAKVCVKRLELACMVRWEPMSGFVTLTHHGRDVARELAAVNGQGWLL